MTPSETLAEKILAVNSAPWNKWFNEAGLHIYIRAAHGPFPLQLASIEAEHPGKGAFTALLDAIEARYAGEIEIENVLTEYFADALLRRGYKGKLGESFFRLRGKAAAQ